MTARFRGLEPARFTWRMGRTGGKLCLLPTTTAGAAVVQKDDLRVTLLAQIFSMALVIADPSSRAITVSGAGHTLTAGATTAPKEAFAESENVFYSSEIVGALSFTPSGQ
jgi:homoserine kinase